MKQQDTTIRLGLVLDQILFEATGTYSTDEPFIRFVEHVMLPTFDRIQLCSRVCVADRVAPYPIDAERFDVTRLPWYRNLEALCVQSPVLLPKIAKSLRRAMPGWDLAIAVGIHPLTPLVLRLARHHHVPAAVWIRGELEADLAHRFTGVRRIAAVRLARLIERSLPRGTPVVSVGRDDYPFLARLGPVHVTYSSKFEDDDFGQLPRAPRDTAHAARILYVGRIAPEKGLELLLEAMSLLGDGPNLAPRLAIVGDDHHGSRYGAEFRRLAEQRSLPGGPVDFAGHVTYGPELFEWYDTHDMLVLPSYTEGFPQVVLEAMVRGIPVISTNVGGIPNVLRDGDTGLLVPPGDARRLAKAIERLVRDPELAARLAHNAQRAARGYTRGRQAEGLLAFLADCYPQAAFAQRVHALRPDH